MNRLAQVIADKCTEKLAEHIKKSNPILSDKLTFNCSLKYLILNDPLICIEINATDKFEIFEVNHGMSIANGPALSEARVSDFLLGATRVKRQYDTLVAMKDSGANSAWLLVSAYYCAFFACIEIAKLFNKISFSLDPEDINDLKYKATGSQHAAFFAASHSNFVGYEYAGKIVFQAVGTKPHVAAWTNCKQSLNQIFPSTSWIEVSTINSILDTPEFSPSRIRNIWNYKRSDFYGSIGEDKAREFKKLIGNPSGSYNWLKKPASRIETLEPCIIPALCEPLSAAVIVAAEKAGNLLREAATHH